MRLQPSRNVDGIEVYALRDLEGSEKRDPQRMKNQRLMCRSLTMQSGNMNLEAIVAELLYNYKISESQLLASYVNKGTSLGAQVASRGVKRAGFHVLRNTLIPAVLVEVGFLTNSQEEMKLRQPDYRQKIADGIAASLVSFSAR
jgi:N-acetylmuramoyl-L-alanine amidase